MARLPQPGNDKGTWGDILNDFLSQSLRSDGSLQASSVGPVQLAPNSVTAAAIANGAIPVAKLQSVGAAQGLAAIDTDGDVINAAGQKLVSSTSAQSAYVAKPGTSDPVSSSPVKKSDGSIGYQLASFAVDAFDSIASAYAALVAAGGGQLTFTAGKTYTNVALTLNQSVPTEIFAQGAIIKPAAGSYAFTLNAGRSQSQNIALRNVTIVCSGVAGAGGVKIVDHYGAALRNVRIASPSIGVLITDASGWSESSQFENVYVKSPSVAGIDLQTAGGTGSFGYANWGLVHVDNIPSGGIGVRCGAGAAISNTTIARLVLHSSADGSIGLQVAGNFGANTAVNAVIESLASAMSSAYAIDIASTGTFDGSDFNLNIIFPSGGGGWGGTGGINNPNTRPFQFRLANGRKIAAATNQAIETSGVQGDTNPMFSRSPDGTLRWGAGGASATDTTLSRNGNGALLLAGALQINSGNFNPFGGMRWGSGETTTSGTIGTASSTLTEMNATTGSITRTLVATATPGYTIIVTRTDSSANTATIAAPSGGSINGKASVTLTQGDVLVLFSTATSGLWIGGKIPAA